MDNHFNCAFLVSYVYASTSQGRIKASAGPGAVQIAGPLYSAYKFSTPTNCRPSKLQAWCCSNP